MSSKKRIALIQGGMGAERNVSLSTGGAFEAALKELGHEYEVIDAQEEIHFASKFFLSHVYPACFLRHSHQ